MNIEQKIPVAFERKNKFDLPFNHVTTSDFMKLRVLGYEHVTKDETFDIKAFANVQPYPFVLPTYGSIRHNIRAFFVPYRLVFPQWHRFFSDNLGVNYSSVDIVDSPVYFYNGDLADMFFVDATLSASLVTTTTSTTPDFIYNNISYNLTSLGRRIASVLYSLGYTIFGTDKGQLPFNALALLALAKVYIDWYANPQYLDTVDVLAIERILSYNDPSTPLHLSPNDIFNICLLCSIVNYDSDALFNFAWDNPVSPISQQHSNFIVQDITDAQTVVSYNGIGTPIMQQLNAANTPIGSEYIHSMLDKVSSYQARHRLAGARSIDRALAQFGVKPRALTLDRSIYIGFGSDDININPIYATANGSNSFGDSVVGDYAGQGRGHVEKDWSFVSDEEGIILCISSLIPSGGLFQGYDRNNRRMLKTDFLNPEFDGIVGIIEKGELFTSIDSSFDQGENYADAFGFSGIYHEQKFPRNFVTGDLRFPSAGVGGSSWHLMREIKEGQFLSLNDVVHSYDFARGTDADQYDRIFAANNAGEHTHDNFIILSHFEVTNIGPKQKLFDTFDWPEDANNDVSLNQNGTQVN